MLPPAGGLNVQHDGYVIHARQECARYAEARRVAMMLARCAVMRYYGGVYMPQERQRRCYYCHVWRSKRQVYGAL